jgi:carboxylesterase type B
MVQHVHDEQAVDQILTDYGIGLGLTQEHLVQRTEHMCGDSFFKIPNYVIAKASFIEKRSSSTFLYHFDQRSRIKNAIEGTTYHAHELLYLFRNLESEYNADEVSLVREFALS